LLAREPNYHNRGHLSGHAVAAFGELPMKLRGYSTKYWLRSAPGKFRHPNY